MTNRPSIPAEITRQILVESGHRCAVCGAGCPLERAHIIPWQQSREHKAENLICLCANCHERADLEGWGEKTLREFKQRPWILRQYSDTVIVAVSTHKIEVIIKMDVCEFDEQSQRLLQYAIAGFLAISPYDVRITSIEETNRIKVTLELPSQIAEKLLDAYEEDDPELLQFLVSFQILDLRSELAESKSNLSKRICDRCGSKKTVLGGKTCSGGHFICKSCAYDRKHCPLCNDTLR